MRPGQEPPSLGRLEKVIAEGASVLDAYRAELLDSGLLAAIDRAKHEFERTVSGTTPRGDAYGLGGIPPETGVRLYGLVRELRPTVAVETGVCNGVSTTMILAALTRNGQGALYSIDFPEVAETAYQEGTFWTGKKGAVIPKGKEPGWVIPAELRRRWVLTIGRSQDELKPLLHRLGAIDFFFHDSEHSEECMRFEYETAWEHLRVGGVLVSDDVTWNTTFEEFSRDLGRATVRLTRNVALLIK